MTGAISVIVGFTLKRPESCQAYSDLLSNGRVDGVVVIDGGTNMQGLTGRPPQRAGGAGAGHDLRAAVSAVRVDDHQVAELAVRHLAGLGHRRIAHISGAQQSIAAVHRREGYLNTLAALGLPVDERLIECGYYRREPAVEAMQKLLVARHAADGGVLRQRHHGDGGSPRLSGPRPARARPHVHRRRRQHL